MHSPSRRSLLYASAVAAFGSCLPAACANHFPHVRQGVERASSGRSLVPELLDAFKMSHTYSMECAQSMPEANYAFRPVPEERSFGQQMVHISEALSALYRMNIEEDLTPEPLSEAGMEPVKSKLDVLNKLESAFTLVERGIAGLTDAMLEKRVELLAHPATKIRVLQFLLEHTAHHGGQIVVYMRLKGVTPPVFRA
jgi:uncharacterized damage-inducible protein DinB